MRNALRILLLSGLPIVFGLSGCATLESTPTESEERVDETADPGPEGEPEPEGSVPDRAGVRLAPDDTHTPEPVARRGLTGDSLYELLVADLAGRQGDQEAALASYLAAARDTRDPRVAERAARHALQLERNAAAVEAAERWIELQPESRQAHSVLARLYLGMGDPGRASVHMLAVIDYSENETTGLREVAALAGQVADPLVVMSAVDRVLDEYPGSGVLHYTRAFQAAEAGDHEAAMRAVEKALAIAPDHVQARLLKADILVATERAAEAIEWIEEARARAPDDRDLALGHVRLLRNLGDHDALAAEMQRVFERFGDDGHAVRTLGRIAMNAGAFADARIYFKRQLAMNGAPNEARYYLGRIAERTGDCEGAMAEYIQVGGQRYRYEAQQRFAVCMADLGRVDEARLHMERLRQSYLSDEAQVDLSRTLAEIEWQAGEVDEALAIMSRLVDTHPEDDDLRYMRAIFAADSGHFELARDDLETLLDRNPGSAHIQNALGYTLADEGVELARARTLIERALEQRPDDAAILDSMGWVLYRQGEYDAALEHLRAAWERSQDAEIGAHLGEVLWVVGERSEARAVWDAAAEQDPEHRVLRDTIERLRE